MNKRWYDIDPTVSLSVSLIKDATPECRLSCADLILKMTKENGVKISNNLVEAFSYSLKRWTDTQNTLREAFEYYKNADNALKKEIAIEIIDFLQNV